MPNAIITLFFGEELEGNVETTVQADGVKGAYISMRFDANHPIVGLTLTNAEALELASRLEQIVQNNGGVL